MLLYSVGFLMTNDRTVTYRLFFNYIYLESCLIRRPTTSLYSLCGVFRDQTYDIKGTCTIFLLRGVFDMSF